MSKAQAHFATHYRTRPTDELTLMVAMAPRFAEKGLAPFDWQDRCAAARAVLGERGAL